ncbi:AraC family transcriptional regulator [Chryseolinea sp. T2]|uniref:AraC family transcriptional regulator n=1 Tax=Chryseolinea sp. T2 TaxID=3129255 RepID=UPI003077BADD
MKPQSNHATYDLPTISVLDPKVAPVPMGSLNVVYQSDDMANPMMVRDMYLPHYSMRIYEGQFSQDVVFENQTGQGLDTVGVCLMQKGTVETSATRSGHRIKSFTGSQNFKYDPDNIFIHKALAHEYVRVTHLSVLPHQLFPMLPDNETWSDNLRMQIESGQSMLGDKFTPITLMQDQALHNIFNCPFDGQLGQMMIETSITQIMLIQLHTLFKGNDRADTTPNKKGTDLAHAVKSYLMSSFLEDHTLNSITKRFGTNTNKLMMTFRRTFGKSVFEYISELRMDHARQLLESREHRVTDVSRIVGFKNPNHFSAAFKKRFSINPSELMN